MRILVDMNLSPAWAIRLRVAGHDAVHWMEVGAGTASDVEIMAYARDHAYVVLTQDLDFGEILSATRGAKPSVVIVRSDALRLESIQSHVLDSIAQLQKELESGALVSISPSDARLRLLPLEWEAD